MVETGNKFHDNASRLISWGHWFTFFNLILISLISLRYIKYAGLADTPVGIAYQFISLIGHASFLCAVVFVVILFPLAFIIRMQRLYRLLAIIISTAALTLLIVDTQIFKLYSFHITPLIWQFLQRPEQVEQIYSINLHYISIPIIFAIELAISYFVWRKRRVLQAKAIGKPIAIFLFTTFVITHLTFIWADATQYRPIVQQKSIYPLSYPMTARSFLTKQGWLSDEKLLKRINQQSAYANAQVEYLHYPKSTLSFMKPLASTPKNVILISAGGLRADMLNENNMPFLHSLSKQGLNYTMHFSGATNRSQGIFSLFYGLPNRYWPEITSNYIPPILMTHLSKENYNFGLFSSIGFVHPEFLQSSFSEIKTPELENYSEQNSNASSTLKWQQWITKQPQNEKWFSFIYYKQGRAAANNTTPLTLTAQSQKLTQYQQQVLAIDEQINGVISTLIKKDLLENTIVIITGTNGKTFDNLSSNDAMIHNAHVPLVVLWPGIQEPRQITRMTSHVDIVPTLMEALFGSKDNPDYTAVVKAYLITESANMSCRAVRKNILFIKKKK
ncbi:DUF3413 domain-containing protein [Psychromonas sp. MME2]|uniref:DUF3413 domain-containing protein n=1 Tax=Psychromonas sp. MME2 TaxID=3231033 RepID=UPI00339C550C